jgi:predicted small lipoprotein YifL
MLVLGVIALTGCGRFSGPLETRQLPRADAPGYTIEEQQKRGRERNSVTEDDFRIGPKGYIDRVSPTGR